MAGTYDVTGRSTNNLGPQFTFVGILVLQRADPLAATLSGTLTLTFSQAPSPWPTEAVPLDHATVEPMGC